MEEIRAWRVAPNGAGGPLVSSLPEIKQTSTEDLLETILVTAPDLLGAGINFIGRQTSTSGGPLDLLGVDGDGRLVVYELKRGPLTRDAVAQVIDYASDLAAMETDELSDHIEERSGHMGVEKIESFRAWYQEQFNRQFSNDTAPRMVLVGLGVDDRARRMVSFLADSEVDISLITFHGFDEGDSLLLTRKTVVEAQKSAVAARRSKVQNLELMRERVRNLNVSGYFDDMAELCRDSSFATESTNASGYSYYLPEITESGSQSNRVYVSLYLSDSEPNRVKLVLHGRAVEAGGNEISDFVEANAQKGITRSDGGIEIWVQSKERWDSLAPDMVNVCHSIILGSKSNLAAENNELVNQQMAEIQSSMQS